MSKSNGQKREPLFHIVKRSTVPSWAAWLIRIGAVVLALLVCAVVTVVITGQNPAEVYSAIIFGAVGSPRRIWSLLQNLAMLLCVSLAVTPAFKMKFWNIGAEGQVLIGYAAEEILTRANDEGADLIVMGTHGRKGIDRILFGSVAEKVVKNASMPVLTVRPNR